MKDEIKKSERIIFEELTNLKKIFNSENATLRDMELIADFYRLLDSTDFTKTLWD